MPMFDFECPKCAHSIEDQLVKADEIVRCIKCNSTMKKVFGRANIHAMTFPSDGVYLEHVSPTGKTFRTRKEMKDFARKNNMQLGYLG